MYSDAFLASLFGGQEKKPTKKRGPEQFVRELNQIAENGKWAERGDALTEMRESNVFWGYLEYCLLFVGISTVFRQYSDNRGRNGSILRQYRNFRCQTEEKAFKLRLFIHEQTVGMIVTNGLTPYMRPTTFFMSHQYLSTVSYCCILEQ